MSGSFLEASIGGEFVLAELRELLVQDLKWL
jgi:hypothetical protein